MKNRINEVIISSNLEFDEKFLNPNKTSSETPINPVYLNGRIGYLIIDIKSFISQRDQKILSAIEEEVEDRKKVMNNLEGDFSVTIFNNIKTTPQGYRKLGYIHAISDIKLILKITCQYFTNTTL